jgi:poly-gamma-glutamate capsule biosynthesis protein CapA/YwtB (metallophosphatase superfamily)
MNIDTSKISAPDRVFQPAQTLDTGTVAAMLAVTAELASLQAQINELKRLINNESEYDLTNDSREYSKRLIDSVMGQFLKKVEL